jgi:hypothetical protein
MQFSRKTSLLVPAMFLAALAASPARAVEPDKHIAADCDGVVFINVRQILNSPLVQKYALEHVKDHINKTRDLKSFLKTAGLDPLKDFETILVTGAVSGGGKPKLRFVFRGAFDPDKIGAAVAREAKAKSKELKIETRGDLKIYELLPDKEELKPGVNARDVTMYAAFYDKGTLIAAQSPDEVEITAKGAQGKINEKLKTALERVDDKASIYSAIVATDSLKALASALPPTKDLGQKLEFITSSIDIGTDLKFRVTTYTTDIKAATRLEVLAGSMIGLLSLPAASDERFAPILLPLIKKIEISRDKNFKNAVAVSLIVTEETLKEFAEAAMAASNPKQ